MEEVRTFFKKIYGFDSMSCGLLFLSILFFVGIPLIPMPEIHPYAMAGYLPLFYAVFRTVSFRKDARKAENDRFERMIEPVCEGILRRRETMEQKKVFRFYHCPECNQILRVPKGKGRVEITCPNCDHKFVRKT